MTQEALKLALEASKDRSSLMKWQKARDAINEALAEHAMQQRLGRELLQEPLELCQYGQEPASCTSNPMDCQCAIDAALAQPEQEPVAYLCENAVGHRYFRWKKPSSTYKPIALYTSPPQRTWVGLTDEEIKAFDTWHDNREEEVGWVNPSEIVAYIEAKLKQKNGYAEEKNT